MRKAPEIQVQDIDHLGIIAGIIDEMGLVEQIDSLLGKPQQQAISAGLVVKAMIINGLGFISAPLYLFEQFFVGKATEHLIGDVPLYLRLADGNEADKAIFAQLMSQFQQQWTFEQVQVMVADSALRQALVAAGESLRNQLGQATQRPTLRWVFQCFQAVHLLQVAGTKQVSNLSEERRRILSFLIPTCRQYYLLC